MKKWTLLLLMFAAGAARASAQPRDIAAISILQEDTSDLERGGNVRLLETEIRLGYPLWRNESSSSTLGVRWTRYDFDMDASARQDFTAHSIRLPLRISWRSPNDWRWISTLTPGLYSDLERIAADDIGLSALLIGSYPWRSNWTVALGAVYGREFGRSRAYPALGVTWTPDAHWTIEWTFPRPRVSYRMSDRLLWTALLEPGGDSWSIAQADQRRNIALSEFRFGTGFEWQFARRIALLAQVGTVFNRELEIREGRRLESEESIDTSWYARIGLSLR